MLDSKYNIISLRRCTYCNLLRVPTTSIQENIKYYQKDYQQGFVTELTTSDSLQLMLNSKFIGTERDHMHRINIPKTMKCQPGDKVFDHGCSWGYGSWQLIANGYDVTGFEVSKPRAQYASNMLNIKVITNIEDIYSDPELSNAFDIFFSSHVIEHVPSWCNILSVKSEP